MPHPQVTITTRYDTFQVDEQLAELIEAMHSAQIRTEYSCQGSPMTWARAEEALLTHRYSRRHMRRLHRQARHGDIHTRARLAVQLGSMRKAAMFVFWDAGDAARFHARVIDAMHAEPTATHEELEMRAALVTHTPPRWDPGTGSEPGVPHPGGGVRTATEHRRRTAGRR